MVQLAMIDRLLNRFVRHSQLTVIYPDGSRSTIGSSVGDDRPVVVRLVTWKAFLLVVLYPDRYLGEAYMNGDLQIEEGNLWDFLEICGRNLSPPITAREGLWFRLAKAVVTRSSNLQFTFSGGKFLGPPLYLDAAPEMISAIADHHAGEVDRKSTLRVAARLRGTTNTTNDGSGSP